MYALTDQRGQRRAFIARAHQLFTNQKRVKACATQQIQIGARLQSAFADQCQRRAVQEAAIQTMAMLEDVMAGAPLFVLGVLFFLAMALLCHLG